MLCSALQLHPWNQKMHLIQIVWNVWWTLMDMQSIFQGVWSRITSKFICVSYMDALQNRTSSWLIMFHSYLHVRNAGQGVSIHNTHICFILASRYCLKGLSLWTSTFLCGFSSWCISSVFPELWRTVFEDISRASTYSTATRRRFRAAQSPWEWI